ncbi:hypothetical protein FRC09_016252 [Ceratobasidium sp. 395]|nr:hypothetical protein FRC09_016252 [Ceratobasidium sp. 395]
MPAPSRYVCVHAVVVVVDSFVRRQEEPYAIRSLCNFRFKVDGFVTIPVDHWSEDGPLTPKSRVFCVGQFYFPPGDHEGQVSASMMHVLAGPELTTEIKPDDDTLAMPDISIPLTSVSAIGILKTAVGRSWFLEVGFYDRESKTHKSFNIEVSVPETKRYENLRPPAVDRLVSIEGVLASISAEEVANVTLESVVYITMTGGSGGPPAAGSSTGRSKRQICSERVGSPIKKVKIGGGEAAANGSKPSGCN